MLQSEAMVAGEYCLWVCIRLRHAILGLGIRSSMHATHTDAMDGVITTSPESMASWGNTGNTAVM